MSNWAVEKLAEERGTTTVTALFFLICMGGLLALLLVIGQVNLAKMRTQQTADIISKGARAAGAGEYLDLFGEKQSVLFATKQDALQHDADVVRGAREEAEELWRLNSPAITRQAKDATIRHQKGEQRRLYNQGIYYVEIVTDYPIHHFWGEVNGTFRRVSQSGIYDF
ncbi:hypothetical protein NDK47_01065 [Brevibacillus ruminantium]|uniref:Flp pilus-assembly TadG-like N-terminal domain-containing protein n=1 Tax=Brevibacillus ruminantium TaxID=2950604 RepID=A0ABY4WGJ0_9BACL|nr:hypothetical protein [Brevibacillus ruminantium]USG65979.1 hypothetical protein NDK47_01065 [Brevibacillus ruminantium]